MTLFVYQKPCFFHHKLPDKNRAFSQYLEQVDYSGLAVFKS